MDRNDTSKQNPEPAGSSIPAGEYRAPVILWEQEFVALALISVPPCDPYSDPNCTP